MTTELYTARIAEEIVYRARLHWILFAPPLGIFVAGLVAALWQPMTAIVLLLASAVGMIGAYIRYTTTEIIVTDRRVVYKSGLLARKTLEMNKDKIESIDLSESLLGRLLHFGSVTLKGTGGGIEAIEMVAAPFELRSHIAGDADGAPSLLPGITEPLAS